MYLLVVHEGSVKEEDNVSWGRGTYRDSARHIMLILSGVVKRHQIDNTVTTDRVTID